MAADLRSPMVVVATDRLDEHRRRVPTAPTIRLRLFTEAGAERGCNLSEDEALALAEQLLVSVRRAKGKDLR